MIDPGVTLLGYLLFPYKSIDKLFILIISNFSKIIGGNFLENILYFTPINAESFKLSIDKK
jgi:hypothetical protein